ncbi:MAG: patatin-like phospholipase family protein [Myxococcota bacterium]
MSQSGVRSLAVVDRNEPPSRHRTILYFAPTAERRAAFLRELADSDIDVCCESECEHTFVRRDARIRVVAENGPSAAAERLQSMYASLVILDLRAPEAVFESHAKPALEFLRQLDHAEDVEARYGFHRIIVLVSSDHHPRQDRFLLELGARGIRNVMREEPAGDRNANFAAKVIDDGLALVFSRHVGSVALCCAGGGITGIYFELGVLKCLADCLPTTNALSKFDMYFGISAGAVVNSGLASGFAVEEIMASIAGFEGGRVNPIDMSVLRATHFDMGGALNRARSAVASWGRVMYEVLRGRRSLSLEDALFRYSDIIGPPFRSAAYEEIWREVLESGEGDNDFRRLQRELFIGATDQDRREHVLFGTRGLDHVPISKAVQASLSFNPAFSPVEIEGRFYEDGAVTRTSNFVEAIERGATLVFVVDPFLPYVSHKRGFARRRGLLFNADQNVRTLSFTRFETTRNFSLRRHPEVSSYTFLPSNRERKLLSVSPMDHRPYLAIWRGAYLSTVRRIFQLKHRMSGDLSAHGLAFDMERALEVKKRLEATSKPAFEDFFVDRQVTLPAGSQAALSDGLPRSALA